MKTKLKIVVSCLLISVCTIVKGQSQGDLSNSKIKLSPKIGVTIANHKEKIENGTSEKGRKAILGFMVGVGIDKPITKNLAIESGLYLVQKGSKSSEDGFSDGEEFYSYSDILKMLYIDVPLLVRYRISEEGDNSFAFYGGIQPSYLLNAKRTSKDPSGETKENVTDLFKKFDAAASIGIGYLFKNGLGINIAYDFGFVNINKQSDPNGFNYFKTFNRVFKITVAYQITK